MTRKIGNKHKAIWFFFTTLLSIFNICTIRIFATNWPLTIVSANAVLSLAGLVFYMHVDEITQKRRLIKAAAFQSSYSLDFQQSNIVGVHASNGELHSVTPQDGLGAFTYVDGTARIWDVGEAKEAVREAAANGGSGYQQFIALYDGKRGGHDSDEFRCYRVLALLDGRACIIDSKTQMHYGEFIGALEKLGVKDALYCDMGSGWNYSWYRNKEGGTVDIIGTPWPFSHNWLTFERAR